jgi:hypothetical protein
MNLCDACETCRHCSQHGCIPTQTDQPEGKTVSTRTIIEINHDRLSDLQGYDGYIATLLRALGMSEVTGHLNARGAYDFCPGIRILAQRHHSETLKLEVK